MTEKGKEIHEAVRAGYARIAEGGANSCCGPSSCCGGNQAGASDQLAQSIGYIDSMANWSDPVFRELADHFPPGTKPSDFVTSLNVAARKPQGPGSLTSS